MTMADAEQLARFCREQLGDEVRAVGLVTDGTVEPTYMRDDLQRRYTKSELDGLEDAATETAGALHGLNTYHTSLGQSHAGLFAFEDAFMLLIPCGGGEEAAYVSLERSVSEDLSAFIKRCNDQLFS
ncbi:DUF7522 family protein [Haloglomus halophilum]|uniref:DUF7522 family protein n=1 Tax=Haloglomus halophilum TaxID=2962672 RepID=UPI0020C98899|nr:hypothetical protein [Haloglomus halophilum]